MFLNLLRIEWGNSHLNCLFLTLQEEMNNFFKVLVLCHTVRVDRRFGQHGDEPVWYNSMEEEYEYQASSPDEKAFVEACCK